MGYRHYFFKEFIAYAFPVLDNTVYVRQFVILIKSFLKFDYQEVFEVKEYNFEIGRVSTDIKVVPVSC